MTLRSIVEIDWASERSAHRFHGTSERQLDGRCLLVLLSLVAAPTCAEELRSVALPEATITGSRVIKRVDGETALPVQVIGREEIERSGVQTVEELLDRVTANFGGA